MRVLAVVAHADDETLGCGATLARYAGAGHSVAVMTFTDGVGARFRPGDEHLSAVHERQAHFVRALLALGIRPRVTENVTDLAYRSVVVDDGGTGWIAMPANEFPDNGMDQCSLKRVAQAVEWALAQVRPDVVYTHHYDDLNQDHRAVAQAVLIAARPGSSVRAIYGCEVPSSTEWAFAGAPFRPRRFIDVSASIEQKIDALRCYASEVRTDPHPRSPEKVRMLAGWRGAQAHVGFAEAFTVLREIVPLGVEDF